MRVGSSYLILFPQRRYTKNLAKETHSRAKLDFYLDRYIPVIHASDDPITSTES